MRRPPPKKRMGQATGRRELRGEILGVRELASLFGSSEGFVRKRAARGMLPVRRYGGRLVFIRTEVLKFLEALDGVGLEEALRNVAAYRGQRADVTMEP